MANRAPVIAGTMRAFGSEPAPDGSLSDQAVAELWQAEMAAAGLRPRTIRERLILLGSFGAFLGKPIITAQRSDMLRFLGQEHLSKATRQSYGSSLRVLFTLLQDEDYRIDNPAARQPRIRLTRSEPDPLTAQQVQLLLLATRNEDTRMMILLGAYQGFRCVEIAAVHGRNIDWGQRRILVREAKGGEQYEVWRPLHSLVAQAALEYPRNGYWFPNTTTNREYSAWTGHILANSVSGTLSHAIKNAGIRGHRPHHLRAFFATELLAAGADPVTVQYAMRHASPATLNRYIKPSQERMRAAMERLPEAHLPTRRRRAGEA